MKRTEVTLLLLILVASPAVASDSAQQRVSQVATTKGLVAFWDVSLMQDGKWTSHHDKDVVDHGYPVHLRRIGDPNPYTPKDWPYRHGSAAHPLVDCRWGSGDKCCIRMVCHLADQHDEPRVANCHSQESVAK
jgi:hypothetical protein